MNNVAAIVLAAGRSERMGAFKPLLPFGNQTVLESTIKNFRDGRVHSIIVVYGWKASEIRAQLRGTDVTFAINPDPYGDMGSSIACGVKELPTKIEAVLISPADLPAIPPSVVSDVIEAWRTGSRLVVPIWKDRGGHPVLVDRAYFPELLTLDSATGLRGLFAQHQEQVTRLPVESAYIARDLDTWDDYRALHQEIFGTTPPELGS